MIISSQFDSGNIEVVAAKDPENIQLNIRRDSNSEFMQWFHFRVLTQAGTSHKYTILNANECSYAQGWEDYQAVASYDRETWFRVNTSYQNGQLVIQHTPEFDSVFYAYFAPYSFERHLNLLHEAQMSPFCQLRNLGQTVDGRDFDMLVIGDEQKAERKLWVIARQHPGESMAEWCAEGLINRLLNEDDPVARKLLERAVFYIVPNMNPDGSVRGNLRSNAAGANLNREWQQPSMDKSPEVYLVRQQMEKTGVDLFLDLHGDEALPFNFVAGSEGVPSYDAKMQSLEESFKEHFLAVSPDFQDEQGYPKDEPGKANLTIAGTWVAERFKCLSFTVEMPFKDNKLLPDPLFGWSPERSAKLGEALLNPVLRVLDQLR